MIRPIACGALFIVDHLHWSLIIGVVNCCKRMICFLISAAREANNHIACYVNLGMYRPVYETKRVHGKPIAQVGTHIVQLGHHGSTSTHLKLEKIKDLFWVPQ